MPVPDTVARKRTGRVYFYFKGVANLKTLRWGFSTGTCAAAASKAALLRLLYDQEASSVTITLPEGSQVEIPVKTTGKSGGSAYAQVIKDGGDDPDVTHGLAIWSHVELAEGAEVVIKGGTGVGQVTKPGLSVAVGEPAINPVPRQMIQKAMQEVLPPGQGAEVIISAPGGEKLAARTLNPRLGIQDGISILGTTGRVRPMSQEAYLASLIPQIDQAVALGHTTLVLTPGGMGAKRLTALGIPGEAVVQTSNFIGAILDACVDRRIADILLFGHIGKIIKVAGGIFNTHSKVADARREILAAHLAVLGAPAEMIRKVMLLNTVDAAVPLIKEYGMERVYTQTAAAASQHCRERVALNIRVGTVLYALDGSILGWDETAGMLGGMLGWNLL